MFKTQLRPHLKQLTLGTRMKPPTCSHIGRSGLVPDMVSRSSLLTRGVISIRGGLRQTSQHPQKACAALPITGVFFPQPLVRKGPLWRHIIRDTPPRSPPLPSLEESANLPLASVPVITLGRFCRGSNCSLWVAQLHLLSKYGSLLDGHASCHHHCAGGS